MKRVAIVLFLYSSFELSSIQCFASNSIVLNDSIKEYYPDGAVEYLADTAGQWTIEDISSQAFSNLFFSLPLDSSGMVDWEDSLYQRFSSRVHWYRLKIDRGSSIADHLLKSYADTVVLYIPDSTGGFLIRKSGDAFRLRDRDIPLSDKVILSPAEVRSKQMNSSIPFPPTIFPKDDYYLKDSRHRFFQMLLSGIFLALIIYSAILFLSLKDMGYLFYVMYLLSFAFFWFAQTGFAFEFLWPNHPDFSSTAEAISALSFLFWYVLFGKTYLNLKVILTKWNKVLAIYLWVFLAFAILIIAQKYFFSGVDNLFVDI